MSDSYPINHAILGGDMQAMEITLEAGQEVIAEAATLLMMEDGITFTARMTDGTEASGMGAFLAVAKRAASGTGIFLTHFINESSTAKKVSFSANKPGKILQLSLSEWGGRIVAEHGSFLCASMGTQLDASFTKRLRSGIFGGTGLILQEFKGDGTLFVHCCGSIIERELHDETIKCEPGAIVAFHPDIDYSIERAGNLKTMVFGGEGLFLATLRGTGKVIMQSLPWSRVVSHIVAEASAK
ncbi:MAG: TIGR00266 family protein [Planctomycetaceae bacterium]|nr:TIGR00266 family protein [Planctomycetaceae bacterium]